MRVVTAAVEMQAAELDTKYDITGKALKIDQGAFP
jgi:hypothetical protein